FQYKNKKIFCNTVLTVLPRSPNLGDSTLPTYLENKIPNSNLCLKLSWLPTSGKKRSYKEAFLQWGFTNIVDRNMEKPQCVLCNKVLNPESMKPSKL
ncbi:jg8750, partial [Pararge aegeria aegeria]